MSTVKKVKSGEHPNRSFNFFNFRLNPADTIDPNL